MILAEKEENLFFQYKNCWVWPVSSAAISDYFSHIVLCLGIIISQNIGESTIFAILMKHLSTNVYFNTHSISGNSLCQSWASIIVNSQLYSSKLFCRIGLEAYVFRFTLPSFWVYEICFIFVYISSTYYIIYCVLCFWRFVFLLELDINIYVFGTSSNFDCNQSNSCYFLLS